MNMLSDRNPSDSESQVDASNDAGDADVGRPSKLVGVLHGLTDRLGEAPLKVLVNETVGEVERHCIEAALESTHGNRSAAAKMLGLSRQSLYMKLARYGIQAD